MSEPKAERVETQEFPAIGFRVGAEEYGLRLEAIQEIITLPRITRVPKAAPYVKGVINLHGNVIPVIDVARRFGIGVTELGPTARIVVVESEEETVGLLAEGVSKVTRFQAAAMKPPPPLVAGVAAEYIEGVVRTMDRFLVFLDLARTLGEDNGADGVPTTAH